MKTLFVVLLLCVASIAFAGQPSIVYEVRDGQVLGPTDLAKAWKMDGWESYCNADQCVTFTVNASLAQWLELYISHTRWEWRILKPGDYATDSIAIAFRSNGNVTVCLYGFGPLVNVDGDEIPVATALVYDSLPPGPGDWHWDDWCYTFQEDESHDTIAVKFWIRLIVVPCDSACEYTDTGTVCFTLDEQKPWVDRETGEYDEDYPPPG